MAKRRKTLEFNFSKYIDQIDSLEKRKDQAVKEAITQTSKIIQKDLDVFFENHYVSGKADDSLITPELVKKGDRYEMWLGFDKTKPHGMLAYLFNKGTPKNNPPAYKFIDKAFRKKAARDKMNNVLERYLKRQSK